MKDDVFFEINKKALQQDHKYRGKYETWLNRAYGMMLAECGMLDMEEYRLIDSGLVESAKKVNAKELTPAEGDLYFQYESALYDEIGMDIACKLHVGRSRNDIYFTEYRMCVRDAIFKVMEEIINTQKVLEREAQKNIGTIIPYYTYGQPAQPGTWAHYLEAIHESFNSDLRRLRAAYYTTNSCPMGAAAGIGSSFNINRKRVAELLGFDNVCENTALANGAVDYYLETISSFGILSTTLGRIGSDLDFFSGADCNILDGDFEICDGSSIMPQKKNYIPGSTMRSQSKWLYGFMEVAFSSAGAVTMFPVLETFEFFGDFWRNVDIMVSNLRVLKTALEHSRIRTDVAYAKTRDGFTAATAMAEELTKEVGQPFVKTHHVVGGMIHKLMEEDRLDITQMTPDLLAETSRQVLGRTIEHSYEEIQQMLDPMASLEQKTTGGTPNQEDTVELLKKTCKVREEYEKWLSAEKQKVNDAYAMVDKGL